MKGQGIKNLSKEFIRPVNPVYDRGRWLLLIAHKIAPAILYNAASPLEERAKRKG